MRWMGGFISNLYVVCRAPPEGELMTHYRRMVKTQKTFTIHTCVHQTNMTNGWSLESRIHITVSHTSALPGGDIQVRKSWQIWVSLHRRARLSLFQDGRVAQANPEHLFGFNRQMCCEDDCLCSTGPCMACRQSTVVWRTKNRNLLWLNCHTSPSPLKKCLL